MSYLVFDSNILIDYLGGNTDALAMIDACDNPVISKIVYMEVMVGCKHSVILRTAQQEDYESTLAAVESMTRNWCRRPSGWRPWAARCPKCRIYRAVAQSRAEPSR